MVCGQMISNLPDYLIVLIATGHEPALASDQFHPATSHELIANP